MLKVQDSIEATENFTHARVMRSCSTGRLRMEIFPIQPILQRIFRILFYTKIIMFCQFHYLSTPPLFFQPI